MNRPNSTISATAGGTRDPRPSQIRPGMRDELKVILCVLAILLLCECGIRLAEASLSRDVAAIRTFPQRAMAFTGLHGSDQAEILFLGNSLTREGVDLNVVQSELNRRLPRPPILESAVADSTSVADWYYGFKKYFVESNHVPDVVVIGFEGPFGGQLGDRCGVDPGRLGQFYCADSDISELFRFDVTTFEDRSVFLLARTSVTFANRDRVQRRILDLVVPHYRASSRRLNAAMGRAAAAVTTDSTFQRLARMISLSREYQFSLVVVAIPLPGDYELDPAMIRLLREKRVPFVDARHLQGMDPQMFPDQLHMNQVAAGIFSRFLAPELANLCLQRQSHRGTAGNQ